MIVRPAFCASSRRSVFRIDTVLDLPGTAFGRSRQQLMREIIGYVPVQPDGSVRVKVPANVPLAISVLDKAGQAHRQPPSELAAGAAGRNGAV